MTRTAGHQAAGTIAPETPHLRPPTYRDLGADEPLFVRPRGRPGERPQLIIHRKRRLA